jgi:hypothetical protein
MYGSERRKGNGMEMWVVTGKALSKRNSLKGWKFRCDFIGELGHL